jgi:hypothetical protein
MLGRRPVVVGVRAVRAPATGGERGAVTAETAMVLPLLVALSLGLVWVLSLAVTQVRVTDGAREVARALARDESRAAALALGRRVAPQGSRFQIQEDGGALVVRVSAEVEGVGGLFGFVPAVAVDAEAVAAQESR